MISENQIRIFNNLSKYVQEGEVFFASDHIFKGVLYRIFSYRLGAYTPFMQPDALEGRGIMFEIQNELPVRLVCRSMHKFFNLNENPATMDLDISVDNIELVMNKADGSLISTYLDHEGELQLKSKTSLSSDQVHMAWKIVNQDPYLKDCLTDMTNSGLTVNLEYIGPDNQIVIGYEKADLRILNARYREDGTYLFKPLSEKDAAYTVQHFEPNYDLKSLENATGFEGVVVVLKTGQWFKLKTPWYAALHHTKDSINSKRRLFECIINEAADDLKAMFFADPISIQKIIDMENLVVPQFRHYVKLVEDFYVANKALDRKSYAIKGQQELKDIFSLGMSKYLGREVDYKEWAVKHIELFGVKDEVVTVEE